MEEQQANGNLTFDIYCILRDIGKRWLIIILCACFAAMGCFVFAKQSYAPVYETKTTFLVTDKNENRNVYTNLETTTTLANVFITLIASDQFKSKVAENMGYDSVPGTIEASQVPETNMINITTYGKTPIMSYQIMQSVLETYPLFTKEIMANAVMDTLEDSVVPDKVSNSSGAVSLTLLGFAGGAVISIAVISLFSFFKDTIKREDDISKKLNTTRILSVPKEKKKRRVKNIFKKTKTPLSINNPTQSFAFVESFKKLRTIIESKRRTEGFKSFVVTSTMENEGKTTISVNLALSLAKKGYSVLLLDTDLRKPAVAKFFDITLKKGQTLGEYLAGKRHLEEVIIKNEKLNLNLISNNIGCKNSSDLITSKRMTDLIETLKERYDYVILDATPLALVADAENIMEHCDATLLVVRQDRAKSIDINDAIDAIHQSGSKLLGCVYNGSAGTDSMRYGYGGYSNYDYGRGYGSYR